MKNDPQETWPNPSHKFGRIMRKLIFGDIYAVRNSVLSKDPISHNTIGLDQIVLLSCIENFPSEDLNCSQPIAIPECVVNISV